MAQKTPSERALPAACCACAVLVTSKRVLKGASTATPASFGSSICGYETTPLNHSALFAAREKIAALDKSLRKSELLRCLQLENLIVHCWRHCSSDSEDESSDSSSEENDEAALPLNDIAKRKRSGEHADDEQGPSKRLRPLCPQDAEPADQDTPGTCENCEQNVPAAQAVGVQHPERGHACPELDLDDLEEEPVLPPIFAFLDD